jgi:hypothetical protein
LASVRNKKFKNKKLMFNLKVRTMKNLKVLVVLLICVFISSVRAEAAGIRKGFNKYEIAAIENLNMGINVEKAWNLKYEGSENGVVVVKRSTPDGCAYIVSSRFFEVCYLSTSKGFGTRSVKKSWSTVPTQINSAVLNVDELKKQAVITQGKVDDEKALGLIASFLPSLINDSYIHLLN